MEDYAKLNDFRYRLRNKKTGAITYTDEYCYGNIYIQIQEYKKNMKRMCLVGVSNETHVIYEVIHLFNNKLIYKEEK